MSKVVRIYVRGLLNLPEGGLYQAVENVEEDYEYYSKSYHRKYGPKVTVLDRRVEKVNPDNNVTVLTHHDKWPSGKVGGYYAAILGAMTDAEAVTLLGINTTFDDALKQVLSKGGRVANICTSNLVISGDARQLEDLRKKLNNQDKRLLDMCSHLESTNRKDVYYGLETGLPLEDSSPIMLLVTSKWAPPVEDFDRLAAEFPGLEITVDHEEPGMKLFGQLVYKGGAKVEDTQFTALEYYSMHDDEFADILQSIQKAPYKKFREEYIKGESYKDSEVWERYAYLLEPFIVQRARLKDLPPLVGKLDHSEHILKERLANNQ